MSGTGVLLLLLLTSSIPVIAVFLWFRLARYPFSPVRFSAALLAGAGSFFPALLFQNLLADINSAFWISGKWGPVANIFIRIALTEELRRLMVLAALFFAVSRFSRRKEPAEDAADVPAVTLAGAAGLIAGLGFAILESAVYGASYPGNTLLRAFTTAPLHGACGFRVGTSIEIWRKNPIRAVLRFLTAVVIHGVYNFMLQTDVARFRIVAILIALSALAAAAAAIRSGMRSE
jgi:RsiW-degrading membrane proteinase PrsW (M82 family)